MSGPTNEDCTEAPQSVRLSVGPFAEGAAGLIDAFSMGLCLIDQDFRVLWCNARAEPYIGNNGEGFLRLLGESGASLEMRKQVREALDEEYRVSFLLRTTSFPPLICSLRPLSDERAVVALVSLTPLSGDAQRVIPHLHQIYLLSNAEAEIAAAAASGVDVTEMARSRHVSVHTLRSQIASIKAKMGLSRMTEVAVTVCRIEAAVTWF